MKHYKWEFLGGILPRMAFTGFLFAQPFLVQRVLDFMTEPEHVNSSNYARGLVAAYGIVYVGIAVCFINPFLNPSLTIKPGHTQCLPFQGIQGYCDGQRKLGEHDL